MVDTDPITVYTNMIRYFLPYIGYTQVGEPEADPHWAYQNNGLNLSIRAVPTAGGRPLLCVITRSIKGTLENASGLIEDGDDIILVTNKIPHAGSLGKFASATIRPWSAFAVPAHLGPYCPRMTIMSTDAVDEYLREHCSAAATITIGDNNPGIIWINAHVGNYVKIVARDSGITYARVIADSEEKSDGQFDAATRL
jgi:hypothetical protein